MAWTPPKPTTHLSEGEIRKYKEVRYMTDTVPDTTITMSKNALEIIANRPYTQPNETVNQMWMRIASHVAGAESDTQAILYWTDKYYQLMSSLRFLPNTPTIAYAGVGDHHCLSACFVDSPDDSLPDIVRVGTETPFIESSGGGIGWGLSKLRPANDKVGHKQGGACGPVRVLHWYSSGGMIFTQGIIRQGAHMAQLHVSHPDIMEFIKCKANCLTPSEPLANVNISVQLTDEFMGAVQTNGNWTLINPRKPEPGESIKVTICNAVDIWNAICTQAWRTGDPGVVFMDRVHEAAPNRSLPLIQSSNPCGEEFLEDGGSCNLGSMNLTKYTIRDMGPGDVLKVDWDSLAQDISVAVRFLDDVIEVNEFPFPHLAEMNRQTRRIGLGVMGWADMLVMLGLRYDSDEAIDLAVELSGFITKTAWKASYKLGLEKGSYPLNDSLKNDGARRNSSVTTIAPTGSISIIADVSSGIEPHFDLMWERKAIWTYDGGAMSTLIEMPAPLKQAVSMVTGSTGDQLDHDLVELYNNDDGTQWLKDFLGLDVMSLYRTSHQVSPEYHVRMQAAWQGEGRTANGVSKTINIGHLATVEDVSGALMLAWELGCKAVTVYRDGSKEQVLKGMGVSGIDRVQVPVERTSLPLQAEHDVAMAYKEARYGDKVVQNRIVSDAKRLIESGVDPNIRLPRDNEIQAHDGLPKRPRSYQGETVEVNTGHGPWFFTVNRDPDGHVLEVFLVPTDNNACIRAGAVTVGRLLSTALRSGVPLETLIGQLEGIDCGHPVWEGGKLINSVYDALSVVLSESEQVPDEQSSKAPFNSADMTWKELSENPYWTKIPGYQDLDELGKIVSEVVADYDQESIARVQRGVVQRVGEVCPGCGQESMFHRGGCLQCMACGHNTCE